MKHSSPKSELSKKRMIQAAGATFREHGVGGVGVDGLARAANFTSGAFYFHFKSKMDAFIASVEDSMDDLKVSIQRFQTRERASWVHAFASFYLGFKRTCGLRDACAVPVLSSEVERAGEDARTAYEAKIQEVFATLSSGLTDVPDCSSREQALALMALLAGGAMISRTVVDPALSEEIGAAVQKAAEQLVAPGQVSPQATTTEQQS
ncbi:MAG TPA: TetR/AcrR family transcriptional regulator [Ktedonobacteraceae bacterium]|nr:TetR/AcrR family transcriptional regulator [Ktedonobacteraceae bacterium]